MQLILMSLAALAVLSGRCLAEEKEPPANVKAFLIASEVQRPKEIELLTKNMAAQSKKLKAAQIAPIARKRDRLLTFATRKEKDAAIADEKTKLAEMKERLAWLKDGGFVIPPIEFVAVGQIGNREGLSRIVQVLGDDDAIGSFMGEIVHWRGIPMKGVTDGSTIAYPTICYVSGTYKYTATSGAQATIFEVEPLDIQEVVAFLKKRNAKPK